MLGKTSRAGSREENKAVPPKDPKAAPVTTNTANEESIGLNLVRACSEALTIAVAKTITS